MDAFDLSVERSEWWDLVTQAAKQLTAKGLPRPSGLGPGKYHLQTKHQRYCYLYYCPTPASKRILIGKFKRPCDVQRMPRRLSATPKIQEGKVITLECGRSVMVAVDAQGLPYPVPVFES